MEDWDNKLSFGYVLATLANYQHTKFQLCSWSEAYKINGGTICMKHFISLLLGLMDIIHLCLVVILGMRQKAK
jgi:hypothetical protein